MPGRFERLTSRIRSEFDSNYKQKLEALKQIDYEIELVTADIALLTGKVKQVSVNSPSVKPGIESMSIDHRETAGAHSILGANQQKLQELLKRKAAIKAELDGSQKAA